MSRKVEPLHCKIREEFKLQRVCWFLAAEEACGAGGQAYSVYVR
jgi:hypothetical protein